MVAERVQRALSDKRLLYINGVAVNTFHLDYTYLLNYLLTYLLYTTYTFNDT